MPQVKITNIYRGLAILVLRAGLVFILDVEVLKSVEKELISLVVIILLSFSLLCHDGSD